MTRHVIAALIVLGVATVGVTGCSGSPQSLQASAQTVLPFTVSK